MLSLQCSFWIPASVFLMIKKMTEFFDARTDGYEAHMMENVRSAAVEYKVTAKQDAAAVMTAMKKYWDHGLVPGGCLVQ